MATEEASGVPSLNDRAMAVVRRFAADVAGLGASEHRIGGARVIDAGVHERGSLEAGRLMAEAAMADLGRVALVPAGVAGRPLPCVSVNVRHPVAACMASQYAGRQVTGEDYFAMGSGPMRAAWPGEALYEAIGLSERPAVAVGLLESGALPPEAVAAEIARACGVRPEKLALLVARTASLAGGVQVVARSVETALHKLHELSFPLARVVAGYGSAPLPPVAADDLAAIGRTNDAVLYGAEVTLYVVGDEAAIEAAGPALPSGASRDHGRPFAELFAAVDHDFYRVDPHLFAPARVSFQHLETGRTFTYGQRSEALLEASFFPR